MQMMYRSEDERIIGMIFLEWNRESGMVVAGVMFEELAAEA